MDTTTELETINVKVKKIHKFACNLIRNNVIVLYDIKLSKESKMGNQQPSLFEGTRTCKKCNATKDITEFYLTHRPGYTTQRRTRACKECLLKWQHEHYKERMTPERRSLLNARARQWRKDNPEKTKQKAKHFHAIYRDRDRKLVYEKYGDKCVCCGETEVMFLTVDHVNSDGHIERKKGLYTNGSQFYRWIIQQNFPKDYQILCYNCNLGRARNHGICPHQKGSTTISQESTAKRLEARRIPSLG